jgi:copper transport protein
VSRADARLRLLVPLVPSVALTGATMLLLSGVVAAVLQLRELAELWATDWGRYVALKSILATVIVALGALNWRRRGPRLREADGVAPLRRTLLIELGIAALLLLVTALLVVTPLPGE